MNGTSFSGGGIPNGCFTQQQRWDGKTNGLCKMPALCIGSSACMKHVGSLTWVMIMFTEGVKDTVTLLLFYLLVIWECSAITCGKCIFQAAVQRRPGCGSGPQEDHCIPLKHSELQAGGGPRTVRCGRALWTSAVRGRDVFKVCTLWMWESLNWDKQSNQAKIRKYV